MKLVKPKKGNALAGLRFPFLSRLLIQKVVYLHNSLDFVVNVL